MGHLTMSQKEVPRAGLVRAAHGGKITNAEGAAALGISVRQFRRLKRAYERRGAAGLQHGNRGRPSPRRLGQEVRQRIVQLLTTTYAGFNDHHATEKLREVEHLEVSRETVRRLRQSARLPAQRRRRPPRHRIRRERQPRAGALVLIDGSQHRWLEDRNQLFTLHGAVDDATGQILALIVRPHEDLHGYVELLHQVIQVHGVPAALYGDRFGALVRTDRHWSLEEQLAGRQTPTHFGQMLEELGIGYIPAKSPQAKGRIERLWGVLQDRLVAELRLQAVATLDATRALLPGFIADYNRRFARAATAPDAAWRKSPRDLDNILACRYPRMVARDNTVSIPRRWIQLPPRSRGRSWHGTQVEARELLDGRLRVIWNQLVLAEQAANQPDFTLVPRSNACLKRAVAFHAPPRPRPAPQPRSRTPSTPGRRSKPGPAWRRFRYGAPLQTGGT
jgi:transposase